MIHSDVRTHRWRVLVAVALASIWCACAREARSDEDSVSAEDLGSVQLAKPELSVDDLFFSDEFTKATISRVYDQVSPALVVVEYAVEVYDRNTQRTRKRSGYCLGVLVSPEGLVMALGHAYLPDAEPVDVRIRLISDRQYDAHVLPKDKKLNVTLFQIDSNETLELPFVNFTEHDLDIGDAVMVMGILTPGMDYARTFKIGRVSSVVESPRRVYATTVPLSIGLMGGPVIDVHGNAVGVIGRDLAPSEGGEVYVRYDYPVVYPTKVFTNLIETPPSESEDRPRDEAWLGTFIQPLTDDLAEYWRVEPTGGVVVSGVIPRSPAERAGIERGDIIKALDGTLVTARHEAQLTGFTKLIREAGPDSTVRLSILRDQRPVEVEVTLTESPKESTEAERYEDVQFGLTVREMTVDVILYGELEPTIQGVVVHSVVSAGWAALAGLQPDDIILNVGDEKITSLDDFRRVLDELRVARPQEIVIFAQRGSRTVFFKIEPQWNAE